MHSFRLLAAALTLSAATAAQAATGSGTISFQFTGFSGPYAATSLANLPTPADWNLVGLVNGQSPTPNGVNRPDGFGFINIGGTALLSGQSVEMVYANAPGAFPTVISFTPAAGFSDVTTGEAFKLGTLSFTNGQWVGGTPNPLTNYPVNLGFMLSTTSSTSEFNQTIVDSLTVVTNQIPGDCNTAQDQRNEADFLYLSSAPQLGSLRVFDQLCKPAGATNTGAVEVWARFGSLHYVDFRNPTGSGFIVDSVDIGAIGGGIPEPTTWAMMLTGFGLAGAVLRRRVRAAPPVRA